MARIGVVHVPYYSHVGAMVRLSDVLRSQGHELVAWGAERFRGQIEAGGVRFEPHEPVMPRSLTFVGFAADLSALIDRHAGGLVEELFSNDVDLVVHDSLLPWARVAAEYLGLPRIVSHPMYPDVDPYCILTDAERAAPKPDPDEENARFAAGSAAVAARFGIELGDPPDVVHSCHGSQATVVYTTEEILGAYGLRTGWHCVGPLMTRTPRAADPGGRPLVYASFGTDFNRRARQFEAVIEGLAGEPVDVVVSTGKSGSIRADAVAAADLGELPANVVVRDFVPARELLARARIHITHGGCNSAHELLLAGVPMLLMPQAFDQFPLAGRIQALGAGRIVDESAEAIREGVRRLLDDDESWTRARELGRSLSGYDGPARVAALVERALAGAPTRD